MSDTILDWDDISDIRYNPFTRVYSPRMIGYGVISAERRTIPTTSPYWVKLYEAPQENVPSSTRIVLVGTGETMREVSMTQTPANKEYRVCYDELGNGIVEFNANQKGLQIDCSYYGLGTVLQRQALATKLEAQFTITLAANDSEASSKVSADYILSAGQDAGAQINTLLGLLGANGGEIKLFEGTYDVKTQIDMVANCTLSGSGKSTVLKRMDAVVSIIDVNVNYVTLKDFSIDGNKATYTGVNYAGIYGHQNPYASYINIRSYNNDDFGFYYCFNVNNCLASGNTRGFSDCQYISNSNSFSNTGRGFYECDNVSNCRSLSNGSNGFENCNYIGSCFSYGNTLNGFFVCALISASYARDNDVNGFLSSQQITGCQAYSNTADGFDSCLEITGCKSDSNVIGYESCEYVSSCLAESNSGDGFNGCISVSACKSISNGVDGYDGCYGVIMSRALSNTANGFKDCVGCQHNNSVGNGTNWPGAGNQNFVDWSGGENAGDTSTGGWNH